MIPWFRVIPSILLLALIGPSLAFAAEKPKLVVLLVIDQFRGDYLSRWNDLYCDGGLKRLTSEGVWFQDCHYSYANTMTGPGHATLSTGCTPRIHGIIANEWYDRAVSANAYCVGVDRYTMVPPPLPAPPKILDATNKNQSKETEKEERDVKGVAPDRLLAPTFADAMKEQLGDGVRVVALSLKDRSSVLPGGKRPDLCYWADKDGRFVTSIYYRDQPHSWVTAFNDAKKIDRWFGKDWVRCRPELDYIRFSGPDEVAGEGKGADQGLTFPHPCNDGSKKDRRNYYAAVANSPYGNDFLWEFAREAIKAEKLGTREQPDFLCISLSSNDLVGHAWGPDSQEVLDMTLRTDILIRDMLAHLDQHIGKGKYVFALSADHGICPLPEVSRSRGLDARRLDLGPLLSKAEVYLNQTYPAKDAVVEKPAGKWLETNKSMMLYLNYKRCAARCVEPVEVTRNLAKWLEQQPGIEAALPTVDLLKAEPSRGTTAHMVWQSLLPGRSGDITVVLKKLYLPSSQLTGTTHGCPHDYDTHVPLMIMGPGVHPAIRKERVSPDLMAVLLARSIGIKPPAKASSTLPAGVFGE